MLAQEVAERAERDPAFKQRLESDPVGTLRELPRPLETDAWIYRVVVAALGLVAVGGLILVSALVLNGNEVPDIFTAAISAAIGAIAGLLAPSPTRSG